MPDLTDIKPLPSVWPIRGRHPDERAKQPQSRPSDKPPQDDHDERGDDDFPNHIDEYA